MKDTFLIQRLRKPPKAAYDAKLSRLFGGNMLQIPAEMWDVLQTAFDIDYMGAAEYEFGRLPRSFHAFAEDHQKLVAFSIHLTDAEIKRIRVASLPKEATKEEAQKTALVKDVYVLCRASQRDEVVRRIKEFALEKTPIKRGARFAEALCSAPEQCPAYGWYELDNGFFFFIDKEMWERTTKLFRDNECDEEALQRIRGSSR